VRELLTGNREHLKKILKAYSSIVLTLKQVRALIISLRSFSPLWCILSPDFVPFSGTKFV